MSSKQYLLLVSFCTTFFCRLNCYAQKQVEDDFSIENRQAKIGNRIVDSLNDAAYQLRVKEVVKALELADSAFNLSVELKYNDGKLEAYSNLGLIYQYAGDYSKSLEYFQKGLSFEDSFPNEHLEAKIFNNLGNLYWRTNDKELAYEYYKRALFLRQRLQDTLGIAKVLGNLGNSVGAINSDIDSSLYYYSEALSLFRALNDSSGISISISNIANIYKTIGDTEKAIKGYHESLKIDLKRNDFYSVSFSYSNLGNIFKSIGQNDSAIYYFKKLLITAGKINSLPRKRQAYSRLYSLYESMEEYEKAYFYLKSFNEANDSLINQQTKNRMADLKLKFDNDLKKNEIELLKLKSKQNSLNLEKNYWQKLFLMVVLISVVIIAIAYRRRLRLKNKLYNQLEAQSNQLSKAQAIIENRNHELLTINETLEESVAERTQELNKAYQSLLISNQRLDHLTYKSAHDLKGPIATILGLINLIKKDIDSFKDQQLDEYLIKLTMTASNMDTLLSRIVASNQIHQKLVIKETFEIAEILEQIVEIVKANDHNNKIVISYEINGTSNIFCDKAILLIIIRYLVNNSIQYMDTGKNKNIITIVSNSLDNNIHEIHVVDNGIGVEPELVPNLFKMFSKGSSQANNTGLGLYDANLLAEKIGGRVFYDSIDKEHTRFVIRFLNII